MVKTTRRDDPRDGTMLLFLVLLRGRRCVPGSATADSALYVKVHLANPVKMSKLKPGDVVEGSLRRDVYSSDRKLFPAGTQVRLTVDHLEKRRRERNDHWPWVINAFIPRHESYPAFKTATVAGPGGESSLQVSLISASRMRDVHAKAKKGTPKPHSADEQGAVEVGKSNRKKFATPIMVLEASSIDGPTGATEDKSEDSAQATVPTPEMLPAGTQCKILLLGRRERIEEQARRCGASPFARAGCSEFKIGLAGGQLV